MKKNRVLMVMVLVILIAFVFMAETALAEPYRNNQPPTGEMLMQAYNNMNIANRKPWQATSYLGNVPDSTYEGALMYYFAVEARGRKGLKKSIEDIRVVHTDKGFWLVFVGMGQKFILQN